MSLSDKDFTEEQVKTIAECITKCVGRQVVPSEHNSEFGIQGDAGRKLVLKIKANGARFAFNVWSNDKRDEKGRLKLKAYLEDKGAAAWSFSCENITLSLRWKKANPAFGNVVIFEPVDEAYKAKNFSAEDLYNNRDNLAKLARDVWAKLEDVGFFSVDCSNYRVADESGAEPEDEDESSELDKNIGDKMTEEICTLLESSHQVILTGAPGTGKTYLAKKVAMAMLGESYANKKWEEAFTDGRVGFCQFHPSYDYSDFVEGLRPVTVGEGEDCQVGFKRMDGVFKAFCKNALNCDVRNWDGEFEKAWNLLVSHIDEGPEFGLEIPLISGHGSFALTLNVSGSGLASQKYKDKVGDKDWISDTVKFFSREQLYNEFRGLSGVPSGGHDSYRKAIVDYMKKECGLVEYVKDNTDKQSDADSPYVFIIDEINRGDISKIFGELFFSIDPGYRGPDGLVKTQYQNLVEPGDAFADGYYVPENVYIIGTMNDIDRSVESMDFAIRRRFVWQEIEPNSDALDAKNDEGGYVITKEDRSKAKERMENLNAGIKACDLLGPAYQIGQAYFLKLDKVGSFGKLWEMNLKPLLREYLRGNPKSEIDKCISDFWNYYELKKEIADPEKKAETSEQVPPAKS